jgi:hypothetical protein
MDIFCVDRLDSLGPLGFKGLELDGKTIRSPMTRLAWDGPIVEMSPCDRCRSLTPHAGCMCGVHATYSAGHVIDQYAHWRNSVVVVVEARGEVILHERGWRAEQCVVRAVVELYAGNVVKHMMNVRASMHFGSVPIVSLEDGIQVVQEQYKQREMER